MALALHRGSPPSPGSLPASGRLAGERLLAALDRWSEPRRLRGVLGATALLGLADFVLGGGNRFTRGPLFAYLPEVDLVPPLTRAGWQHAFAIHQQSPLYALCGGYEIGGMESLTVYRLLYLWEWTRIGTIALLSLAIFLLLVLAVRGAWAWRSRTARRALVSAGLTGTGYLGLRALADHAGLFSTINLGQHRDALDVTCASLAIGVLIAAATSRGLAGRGAIPVRLAWGLGLSLTIAFGALVEAMDAGALWRSFPFYSGALLPGADRLFAFAPVWRNLFENGYLIQASHRVLAFALVAAALLALVAGRRRGRWDRRAAALLVLLTLEGALGAMTVMLGEPLVLSVAHQVLAIGVLAAALAPWRSDASRPDGILRAAPQPA